MRVARASKPRRAIVAAPTAVLVPFSLFETGTPFAFAIGRLRKSSSVLRSPDFEIVSRLKLKTGFGPTSSAVGIFEPVTMIRSVVAWVLPALVAGAFGAGAPGGGAPARLTASCATALEITASDNTPPTARAARKHPNLERFVLFISLLGLMKGIMNRPEAFKTFLNLFQEYFRRSQIGKSSRPH